MNLLVVNWLDPENPEAGGAEIHLFEIFGRLAERGHRVRVVCSGWRGAPERTTIRGVHVRPAPTRYSFALVGRRAVRRALREEQPDVLVEDVNKLPLFVTRMTEVPGYVIVPHLFGETAFREIAWPLAAVVWLAERPVPRAYRGAAFHAISESTRDDLVDRGVAPAAIRVIHPGVDAVRYAPVAGLDRTPRPSFLFVGRLKRYKGIDFALRALALALKARPDLSLDIAGTGDALPGLKRVARELGIEQAVRFLGFISEEDKLRLLRTTWANVFPSVKEGWGITIMEAAACGTPSLASNSPGLRDSVRDGRTGFLVPHGDAEALAARMLELAEHPALVDRLGQAARAHALEHSWKAAADATEAHLRDVLAAASHSSQEV